MTNQDHAIITYIVPIREEDGANAPGVACPPLLPGRLIAVVADTAEPNENQVPGSVALELFENGLCAVCAPDRVLAPVYTGTEESRLKAAVPLVVSGTLQEVLGKEEQGLPLSLVECNICLGHRGLLEAQAEVERAWHERAEAVRIALSGAADERERIQIRETLITHDLCEANDVLHTTYDWLLYTLDYYEKMSEGFSRQRVKTFSPAAEDTCPLPGDVFPLPTGPASQGARRSCGGPEFWQQDQELMALRTTPLPGQQERIRQVYEPAGEPPLLNRHDPAAGAAARYYLREVRADVAQMGPDEADWFDLLVAMHLPNWHRRTRDDPRTWVFVPVDALKRMRTCGHYKGFRDPGERSQHLRALQRVLRWKLVWESAPGGRESRETFGYFESIRVDEPESDSGFHEVRGYRIFPTWWFEAEMLSSERHTPMFFESCPRMVLQIPPNKSIAKAISRHLVGGFWRQQATKGRGFTISIRDLHDRAGIALPDWASSDPKKYAERFIEQLRHISDPLREGSLIAMPQIALPDRRKGGWERWLKQEIELRPHPQAPAALLETIAHLEARGNANRKRQETVRINAEARHLAAKKRGKGAENRG